MKKIILVIMTLTVLSKILGFGRELVLSYYFGASFITDAYLVAIAIPSVIFGLIGAGINSAFIPMYSNIFEREGKKKAYNFASKLLFFLLIVCTISLIIVFLFTSPIVKLFASGFSGEVLGLTIKYTRIAIFISYFVIITSLFTALLQINNKFYVAALIGVPFNLIYMIGIYIAYMKGNIYLPITAIIAFSAQSLMLYFQIKRLNYKFSFDFKFRDSYLKNTIILALPAIIGSSLEQVNYLVDKTIASRVGIIGGITLLNYASRLNLAISGIFISSLLVVFFPKVSKLVVQNDKTILKKEIDNVINFCIISSLPISIFIFIFNKEIILFLFQRGNFSENNAIISAKCLGYYGIAFTFIGLREIITKIFYALNNTKTPVINASIGIIFNIILNILLSSFLGLPGIALATTVSVIFTVTSLIYIMQKKYRLLYLKNIFSILLKVILSCIFMSIILIYIKDLLHEKNLFINLFSSFIIGIFVYFLIISYMKIKIVDDFKRQIKDLTLKYLRLY